MSWPRSVSPVAASIRWDFCPNRRTSRPAKFHFLDFDTVNLPKLELHNLDDLSHILHRHQVLNVETQSKSAFQAAGKLYVAHGIPGRNVAGCGIDCDRLRIDAKRRFEGLLYFWD